MTFCFCRKEEMTDDKKPDLVDRLLVMPKKQRAILIAVSAVMENLFTFSMYCYLGIWPMIIITLYGVFAFCMCALNVGRLSYGTIFLIILSYALLAVPVSAGCTEWRYGFQNYLFVLVPISFTVVYRDSNFKKALKYAAVTFLISCVAYYACIQINIFFNPQTGKSAEFMGVVNGINAFFVFLLILVSFINLFAELFEEKLALRVANGKLAQYANRDPLTNLYNRRFAEQLLTDTIARASAFSVVMCDLDHFKQVNDTYGHAVGDEAIKYAARIIQGNIHYRDYAVRWGGDEFLLIINHSDMKLAIQAVKRIMSQLRNNAIEYEGHEIQATLTTGIALFTPGVDTLEDVLKCADKRLYLGKEAGRNRYVADDGC